MGTILNRHPDEDIQGSYSQLPNIGRAAMELQYGKLAVDCALEFIAWWHGWSESKLEKEYEKFKRLSPVLTEWALHSVIKRRLSNDMP